jgi:hypothetical protein
MAARRKAEVGMFGHMTAYLQYLQRCQKDSLKTHSFQQVYFTKASICTDKKEKKIFLIYREILKGSVSKSYVSNSLLIYG